MEPAKTAKKDPSSRAVSLQTASQKGNSESRESCSLQEHVDQSVDMNKSKEHVLLKEGSSGNLKKDEQNESEDDDGCLTAKLKDLKALQKLRQKSYKIRGLSAQSMPHLTDESEETAMPVGLLRGIGIKSSRRRNRQASDAAEFSDSSALLGRSFQAQGDSIADQKVDKHLEEFLAANVPEYKSQLQGMSQQDDSKDQQSVHALAEQELQRKIYEMPDRLKIPEVSPVEADKMAWVTGLMEMPVSIETKLRNIEETEKAKRKLLRMNEVMASSSSRKLAPELLSAAINNSTETVVRTAFGSRFQHFERPKSQNATDDVVMDRFRKRMRNK